MSKTLQKNVKASDYLKEFNHEVTNCFDLLRSKDLSNRLFLKLVQTAYDDLLTNLIRLHRYEQ